MAGLVGGSTPHPGWAQAACGGAVSPSGPDEENDVHCGVRAGVDGWTEGCVQLGSRHPAHRTVLPVWPLASRAPAGWRTGRSLRGGGLNEPVCTPSCPAGRRLAQGLGDGCRAALGGPGCAPPRQRQLGASELQACRSGWQREAQVSPWTQRAAGPRAGGGPLVRHPAVGAPGMAEAGGWKAEPPTRSPSPPGCTGPGHVLDGSARRPGVPSWTCCQLRKREPHGSRPGCFVCGGKGSGQEGAVAGGPCRAPFCKPSVMGAQ